MSGVTNKTTCNDIIKALIDDELSNGNGFYCNRQGELRVIGGNNTYAHGIHVCMYQYRGLLTGTFL